MTKTSASRKERQHREGDRTQAAVQISKNAPSPPDVTGAVEALKEEEASASKGLCAAHAKGPSVRHPLAHTQRFLHHQDANPISLAAFKVQTHRCLQSI